MTNGPLTTTSGTPVTVTPLTTGSTSITTTVSGNTQTATLQGVAISGGTDRVLTGNITNTANNPAALPAPGTIPANINVQGVVNGSGVGAATVSISPANTAPSPVSKYAGQVSVSAVGNVTTNVVGVNPTNPGVNQVPATQTGTVQTSTPN